jgi:hypothetical protein
MKLTSSGRKSTGHDQGGRDGQATNRGSNSASLLPHERCDLLHHDDLDVEQLKPSAPLA